MVEEVEDDEEDKERFEGEDVGVVWVDVVVVRGAGGVY